MLMKSSETNRLSVNTSSSNPSSSHSPSVTGEQIDVKVEITPPPPVSEESGLEIPPHIPKSFSNESNSTLSVTPSDYQGKPAATPSPQQRKYSEIGEYSGLLSAVGNLNRLNPSPTGSTASTRFFKRIEEMIDLSSPYNHYKCLSPSETNLSQFIDARTSAFTHHRSDSVKPGSGRLLRRQFSLDKDDAAALQQSHRARQEANKSAQSARMLKQHSISTAQDLEKIEENPISPQNSQNNHNGNDNSIKKSDTKSMSLNANDSTSDKNDLNLNVERLIIR